MFTVIKSFTDLQDGNYLYLEGDTYPREGLEVSDERLAELSTTANRRGEPLIAKVEEPKEEEPSEPLTEEVEESEEEKPKSKPKKSKSKK